MAENEKIRLAYYDCICQDITLRELWMVSKACILSELQLLCEKKKISSKKNGEKLSFYMP